MAKLTPIDPAATIPASQLAELAGLTGQRLGQLVRAGIIPAASGGKYLLLPTFKALIGHYRDAAKRPKAGDAKVRKTETEIALLELQLARERGELVSLAGVQKLWGAAFIALRDGIRASNLSREEQADLINTLRKSGEIATDRAAEEPNTPTITP